MEAQAAISGMNGTKLFFRIISVDWAFSTGPFEGRRSACFHELSYAIAIFGVSLTCNPFSAWKKLSFGLWKNHYRFTFSVPRMWSKVDDLIVTFLPCQIIWHTPFKEPKETPSLAPEDRQYVEGGWGVHTLTGMLICYPSTCLLVSKSQFHKRAQDFMLACQ